MLFCLATRNSQKEQRETIAEPQLALLPTKFRKLVWLKRNDFVIVQTADDTAMEEAEEAAITTSEEQSAGAVPLLIEVECDI